MTKFNISKSIFSTTISLCASLALLGSPLCAEEGAAYAGQGCCERGHCQSDWCILLLPALAGAGTGAAVASNHRKRGRHGHRGATGASGAVGQDGMNAHDGKEGHEGKHGHRGHHGPRGHRGPKGEKGDTGDFCVMDVGQTLSFNFSLTLSSSLDSTGDIVPFVETPDGTVIEGEDFNPNITTDQTATILLNNPCYGTYHFGYFIPPHNEGATATSVINVITSRDDRNTVYTNIYDLGATLNSTQVTNDFTYFINEPVGATAP